MIKKYKHFLKFFSSLRVLGSLSFFLCLSFIFLASYCIHINRIKVELRNEATLISNTLEKTLDFSGQLIDYISKRIRTVEDGDVKKIAEIIGRSTAKDDRLSWLNLGWIDASNKLVFMRKIGFIDPPCDLSERTYVKECLRTPNRFFTSQVVIGATIGIRKIPGGVGVTNFEGNHLGVLCAGITLVDLNHRVQQNLITANFSEALSYVVLDQDSHIILKSSDNKIDVESSYYKDSLENGRPFLSDDGVLTDPITYKGITYSNYKKVKNYPYYILTGVNYDNISIWHFKSFLLTVLGLLLISGIFILLFLSQRKKAAMSAELFQNVKLKFLSQTKKEMLKSLDSILVYSEVLIKNLKQEKDVGINEERQLGFLKKISEATVHVVNQTTSDLDYSLINVNSVIKECILIQSQKSKLQNVKIETHLYPKPPRLYVDALRFKQIILGVISISLDCSLKKRGFIKISTVLKSSKGGKFLEIIFEDNGFPLEKEEIHHFHNQFEDEINADGVTFNIKTLEKLIKLHNGYIQIESRDRGKRFTVVFPYKTPDPKSVSKKKKNFEENLEKNSGSEVLPNNVISIRNKGI